jgi:hypothetical protein
MAPSGYSMSDSVWSKDERVYTGKIIIFFIFLSLKINVLKFRAYTVGYLVRLHSIRQARKPS